ncbi:hypothetical protein BC829DRAFT_381454 [Chytridium lagenaria]|nr:hypothetical protein BC829DRAFT_381454 [Chytridium lagenaria]
MPSISKDGKRITPVSGMVAAIQLQKQLGMKDYLIIEKSRSGWGGTWNKNTYPGAACDVLGHVYCFSFALNPNWSKKWPDQPEIQAYFERVAQDYNLASNAQFGTEVISGVWSETDFNWTLTLRSVDTGVEFQIIARAIISGVGQLNNPAFPNIPGMDTFKGPVVHSAMWKHDLKYDNRIAVIGTGASAIQMVPELVKTAKKLDVYQRSPAYLIHRGNFKYSGLFKWVCRNVPFFNRIYRIGWFLALSSVSALKTRAFLKKVTPTYPIGCKRLLISDDWFSALQAPNSTLIVDPIVRISPTGVVVRTEEGKEEEREVDTIPMEFIGRGGKSLRKTWKEGAEAYRGFAVHDFPNLFVLYGPNTNLGHNNLFHPISPTPYICVKKPIQEAYNRKRKSGKITTQWSGFVMSYWIMTLGIWKDDFEQVGNNPFVEARARESRIRMVQYTALAALSGLTINSAIKFLTK